MNPEEKRQLYIVRQSQVERAIEYWTLIGKQPSSIELLSTADLFTEYIFNGVTDNIKARTKKLDSVINK